MHITFGRLFLSSRSLGSNFWLMTAIISSSVTAFLFALPLAMYFNIPLDPVCLVEALPFLVCTVGFDKPLRLARAVFTHPHVTRPAVQDGKWRGQMKLAGDVVLEAVDQVGNGILRDYALEVAVLLVGASSHVGGLREFCALAALALTLDCFMLSTFYTAILAVMIEVSLFDHETMPHRIWSRASSPHHTSAYDHYDYLSSQVRRIKLARALTRSRRNSTASDLKPSSLARPRVQADIEQNLNMSLRQRVSAAILGVKGSFLRQDRNAQNKNENPVARLRLLLVCRHSSPPISGVLMIRTLDRFLPYAPYAQPLHDTHARYGPSTLSQPPLFQVSAPVQRARSRTSQEGRYHLSNNIKRSVQSGYTRPEISIFRCRPAKG